MAENSFDIVSQINFQEVDNALNQTRKEISQRYDFKDSKSEINFNQKEKQIILISDDEFKMKSLIDVLQSKMIKRGIHIKALKFGKLEPSANMAVKQIITLRVGIEKEDAKKITQIIRDLKLKVNAQIMDDQVRVTGKSRDDLQNIIQKLKSVEIEFPIQFLNYR